MNSGRCYTTGADVIAYVYSLSTMADVIAIIVVDVVTTLYFFSIVCGWCYCHICVEDVIATKADVYCLPYMYFMADVIAKKLTDVIATEADVIAYHIYIYWLMLLPR